MRYDDVMNMVLSNPIENWTYFDTYGQYVFKEDVNLRIVRCNFEDKLPFDEDWATRHPDHSAYKYTYTIYYINSIIDEFELVAVDGLRAYIPMPLAGVVIPRRDYLLARAVDDVGRLDEYIARSGLTVEE